MFRYYSSIFIAKQFALCFASLRLTCVQVATVAIEHVYMFMNSSIIHDEILAHRLGLIPIMANPRMFEFMGEEGGEQDEASVLVVKVVPRVLSREVIARLQICRYLCMFFVVEDVVLPGGKCSGVLKPHGLLECACPYDIYLAFAVEHERDVCCLDLSLVAYSRRSTFVSLACHHSVAPRIVHARFHTPPSKRLTRKAGNEAFVRK